MIPRNYAPSAVTNGMTPRQYAKFLHEVKGIEYSTACAMANYDVFAELRMELRKWTAEIVAMAICACSLAVFFWSLPAKAEIQTTSERNEALFAACLNGVTLQVGNRQFQCLPSGAAPR